MIVTRNLLAHMSCPYDRVERHIYLGYYTHLLPEHTVHLLTEGLALAGLSAFLYVHHMPSVPLCKALNL